MSTDVDGVAAGILRIQDTWASVIEIGFAIYFLRSKIGKAAFLVLIPTFRKF